MSFTLTNDELNILYLNGMTDESIQSDIAFKYGNDMSDEEIYAGYKNMIDELRPVTKTSINDTKNISEWKNKGGIGAFEYGQRNSILYDNIKGEESPIDTATRFMGDAYKKVDNVVNKIAPEFSVATKLMGGIARNRVLHEKTDGTTGKDNKIDFGEALGNSIRSGEWLPFIGGFLSDDGLDAKRERTLREKITNGESIYQSDLDFLNYRINKRQEESVRKYTIGGHIADSFLPSLVRFGGEIATGTYVLESLGFASKIAETASVGQKIAHGFENLLFSGAINTVLPTGWNDVYETYQGRMLDNETKLFNLTDKGEALFNESFEKPATAFLKSLGQTFIMFSSEASGELLGLAGRGLGFVGGKYVATPISEYLKQNKQLMKFTDKVIPALSKMYEKLQGLPVVGKSYDWLASRVKFDGFLEEMGEEVLEDVLNLTLGTQDEERSLENYAKALFKSPDEWAIIAGAIALQGGTLSVASHLIGSEMEANGASSAEIIEALRGLTESEKEEVIFNKIQTGELNIDELSISNKVTNNIKEELKTNAINNGVREDLAEKVANLATNMLITRADDNDVNVEDIYKELAPKVQYNDFTPTIQGGSNITLVGGVSNTEGVSQEDIDYYNDLAEQYENELFQLANTAGAETSAEVSDAIKEWQEKGTDSKYFQKWFGDSKVVDEEGKPKLLTDGKDIYITDGYSNNGISRYSYKGSHRSPSYSSGDVQERLENSEDVNLFEVAQGYHNQPDDYFSPMGARYYMYDDKEGLESARAVRDVIAKIKNGKENITVKIYRAVPADVVSDKLKNGDWVTLSKSYAIEHGEQNLDGEYKIIEKEVPISEVWWDGNDLREWGYDNGKEQEADLYLKIENPKYQDALPANWQEASELRNQGYDGVITSNGEYLVFEKTQIKSVDNRGTFDENNANIYFQSAISSKTSQKAKEVINALKKIADGSEEETVKGLRDDLEQYGGTNDVTFVFGNDKKGIKHIAQRHGAKTLLKVFDTVVDGKVLRYVPEKKTVIISKGDYEAVLSLDENGNKKTWLLSGWNTKEKSSDASSEVGTQSTPTQIKPTFSRQDLGAELNNSINDIVKNFNPINNDDEKNLLMTHNAKIDNLDAILESGSLIAPSFAITKKDNEVDALSKFGNVTFIRKPENIKFGSDNIYNRDIYSPRMPKPEYQLKDGTVIDSYEKEAQERLEKEKPERYKERFDKPTSERFKDAKKVMFLGYTPSGNRRYKPYTAENIIAQMKKEGLVSGENFDYGLSSLMSRFATKQKNMKDLKESAKEGLFSSEKLSQDYENLKKEYEELGEKVAPLYYDKWAFYEFQSDVFYAIAKNKKKYLKDTYDIEVPSDIEQEVKDFVKKAQELPRSYFEAKPMREVGLNEFGYALARVGTLSKEQKNKLKNYNINVIEYKDSIKEALDKVETEQTKVYFQSAYHGTKVRGLENTGFDLSYARSGEGNMAHGYGVYTAKDKEVSENYRKGLIDHKKLAKYKYDNTPIEDTKFKDIDEDTLSFIGTLGKEETISEIKDDIQYAIKWGEDNKDIQRKETLEGNANYIKRKKRELELVTELEPEKLVMSEGQLYEVDIPEDEVMLNEDLMFSEQPEKVQTAIKQICEDYADNNKLVDLNVIAYTNNTSEKYKDNSSYKEGRNIYDIISKAFGSDKEASLLLNEYGIKGIKYNGLRDGECYVVFDDKAVQVLNTFYQEEQQSIFDDVNKIREAQVKGSYIPVQNLISLFKTADESTIVHELGHWYLNSLQQDADNGSTKAQEKLDAVRKFVKNHGEELTTTQHEKFAKGFEAYIRSGYARTNRLKNVFEDFKNSLLKIYDDIKDMFWFDENGNEQRFTEEDLNRINPLFERLMSTENERIQATVFNRIAQLNEEKEKIKEKQYEELAELEEMRNSNILESARKEKNKQLTQEFLEKAENFSYRESKEKKDYRKRFKDVTLQILASATGKSKQWVANSRNWNKLQEMIETSDGLSSGVGFLREWAEFYENTDLSDNSNDAVGREEEFLQKVYDRLVSDNYSSVEEDLLYQYYGEAFYKEETWRKKFDYLYGKLMTVKNEEKQACFDAIFELFSDVPSTDMDFVSECLNKLQEAEKYISEKTGSIEKSVAKKNVPLTFQFKQYILRKLGNQKVYDAEKGIQVNITNTPRLNGLVNKVNTLSDAQNAIRLINNFLIEQIENKQKSILHKEIQKQIKINSQSIKVGALRKGKFDWRTNTIFATLQELNKTPVEAIQKQLGLIAQVDSMADNEQRETVDENTQTSGSIAPQDEQEKLKLAFLEYKSKKVNELDVQQASKLLEGILKLKFEGRRAKNEKELARALETYKTKTNIAEIITKKLSNNEVAKYLARWVGGDTWFTSEGTLANWESLLNAIADKNVAQEFSLLWDEAEAEVYANKKMIELHNIIAQVYGFAKTKGFKRIWNKMLDFNEYQEIVKLFREYEKPINTYTVKTASWNRHTKEVSYSDIDINRSQIMMFFGWSQNKQLRERLVNMFGENQLQYLFSQLSIEDKTLMFKLIDFCDSMYADTNEVFINITGLSLPKVENYLPSKAERVLSEVDMLQEGVQNSSVSNFSATKQRKNCSKIKMKAVTPLEVLIPHINKTARYVVLAEKMNYYKKIFIDAPEIKDALINVFKNKTISNNVPVSYDYINYEGDATKQIKLYMNNNINVDKIDAVTLSPILPFKVSDKPSDNKHNLVDSLGLKNGKTKKVTNNNTGETVKITKGTIEKSVSNKVSNGVEQADFVNIIYNIENLFETSQMIISHNSYKGESDIRIDRYANIAEIDDKQYLLEFIVKNGEEVKLYSVDAIDKKETTSTNAYVVNDQSALDAVNNSITYIQNFIKSRLIEKHNVDYKESLKQNKNIKKASKDKGKETAEKLYRLLVNQLSCSMFDNYAKSICMAKSLFDTVSNNWISAAIGGNFKVLLSQLPAVINYSENMPFNEWVTGFASSAKNYKETLNYMFDNWDYLKSRIAGNSKDEILSQVASGYDKFKYFRSFSTANTRWGDVMTLCFGGKPYVDYLINEQGLSKEEAFKKLTENTLRSQTSGHNSATSLWQKKQAQHWLSRMFFAFRNADMQYERKFIDALSQYSKGDATEKELAKAILLYKVFNPILFSAVVSDLTLFSFLRGMLCGDDDDAKNELVNMISTILLSNLNSYGAMGTLANIFAKLGISRGITNDYVYKPKVPLLGELIDVTDKLISKEELTTTDVITSLATIGNYAAGGLPTKRFLTMATGIVDSVQGDIGAGLLELLGYGRGTAYNATTGERPPKNR